MADFEATHRQALERGARAKRILDDPYFSEKITSLKNMALADFIQSSAGPEGDLARQDAHWRVFVIEQLLGLFRTDIQNAEIAQIELEKLRSK